MTVSIIFAAHLTLTGVAISWFNYPALRQVYAARIKKHEQWRETWF